MDVLIGLLGLLIAHPWLVGGVLAGLALRTIVPWLWIQPRPPFDPRALVVAALGGFGALSALLPKLQVTEWWLALAIGLLAGVGGQTTARYLVKPLHAYKTAAVKQPARGS